MIKLAAACIGAAVGLPLPVAAVSADDPPLYIAFAGPYSSSPASAFGHVFLVMPNTAEEPAPLWDVVSFSARTFDAGPLRFMSIGVLGGFHGRYERLDFHEKTHDYQTLEDRDLWLIEINIEAAQRANLEAMLSDAEGRWYPYDFFFQNCAYYLQLLLAQATGIVPEPDRTVSPTELMSLVQASEASGQSFLRPSASHWLEDSARSVEDGVVQRLKRDEWWDVAADTTWVRQRSEDDRRFLQQFFSWKARHTPSSIPPEGTEGIRLLRSLNQQAGSGGEDRRLRGLGRLINTPDFHRYTRLSLRVSSGPSDIREISGKRMSIRYRGALHDEADPWTGHAPLNTLEFLGVEVSSPANNLALRLDEVVLFSQRSLMPSTWIMPRGSWLLEAQARRGGLFGAQNTHLEVRTGSGRTWAFGDKAITYALFTVAGVFARGHGSSIAPGAEVGGVVLQTEKLRYGFRLTREVSITNWARHSQRLKWWIRYDLPRDVGIRAQFNHDPKGMRWGLIVDLYPGS